MADLDGGSNDVVINKNGMILSKNIKQTAVINITTQRML